MDSKLIIDVLGGGGYIAEADRERAELRLRPYLAEREAEASYGYFEGIARIVYDSFLREGRTGPDDDRRVIAEILYKHQQKPIPAPAPRDDTALRKQA